MACPSFLLLLRTIASIFMESSTRMISSVSIIITQYKHYRLKYPNVGMSIGFIYLDYYFLICTGVELLSQTECIASMGILKKRIGVGSLMTQSRQKMEGPKCCWLTPMADAVPIFIKIGWCIECVERDGEKNAIKIMDFYALPTESDDESERNAMKSMRDLNRKYES